MIELKNVYKSFGEKQVLTNFSLSLIDGERCCLMGPSGCGKTTIFNLLLGLLSADSGSVTCPAASAVFQENRLCEDFSAVTNVKMVMPKYDVAAAKELLRGLLLGDDLYTPVREFSGGMKRRVAIARALACDRDTLLLDEPFKGLDSETRAVVAEFINKKTAGKTLLLISHDAEEAAMLNAKTVILK